MLENIQWQHLQSIMLNHHENCYIAGLMPEQSMLYVGELYGDDWTVEHRISLTDFSMVSWDEAKQASNQRVFNQPRNLIEPVSAHETTSLQYVGARWRGMREAENLADLVQPISVMEKMAIIKKLGLSIPAMMLFGVAESRVLAEAHLQNSLFFVCRRIRLAIALSEVKRDADQQPYDYDTLPIEIVHLYDVETDEAPPIIESLMTFGETPVHRPMDCLLHDGKLYIADGGDADRVSHIHIFNLEKHPPNLDLE